MFIRKVMSGAVAAAAASAALPVAAGAAGVPTRTFDVSLTGTQTTTFSEAHAQHGQCDQAVHGTGSEVVTFRSTGHNNRVQAQWLARNVVHFGTTAASSDEVEIRARVERHRRVVTQPLDPRCEGTGGSPTPTPAPKPDCGVHRETTSLALGWWPLPKSQGIRLEQGLFVPITRPFKNCGVVGTTFPEVQTSTTGGQQIVARIPPADLFNPAWRKHIIKTGGTFVSKTAESSHRTTIRWTISLTEHR